MDSITSSLLDIINIGLLLATCYACYIKGINKGRVDTLEYFEEQGFIEREKLKE